MFRVKLTAEILEGIAIADDDEAIMQRSDCIGYRGARIAHAPGFDVRDGAQRAPGRVGDVLQRAVPLKLDELRPQFGADRHTAPATYHASAAAPATTIRQRM